MADDAPVCSCHNVSAGIVRAAVDAGNEEVPAIKACTKAGTGCGSCVPILQELIDERLTASGRAVVRSEEHTSELQSLMRISYAVFCLKKKKELNRKKP